MTAATYPEPYRLPAGVLALAVHGVFFVLLYFGFSWQTQPAATMSAELWSSIPGVEVRPAAKPKPKVVEPVEPEPEQPEEKARPDIEVPDKKAEKRSPVVQPHDDIADRLAREQAERAATTGRVVDEFVAKIQSKIRRNIVMPPDVAGDARAEFSVTVLPGGSVLPPRLLRSSGNAAYDNAVERAILKSEPLPLPADAGLYSRFRELKLVFRPGE
ncbi:MAG: TonB C-terminal domain-containing protein [Nitrosomonadales bacterium]|nr:TonB C-terminal domain-containing protein [Nitrosomonadales bacterium]